MPHVLTAEQQEQRVVHVKDLLEIIAHDPNFLDLIITGDKVGISYTIQKQKGIVWPGM